MPVSSIEEFFDRAEKYIKIKETNIMAYSKKEVKC